MLLNLKWKFFHFVTKIKKICIPFFIFFSGLFFSDISLANDIRTTHKVITKNTKKKSTSVQSKIQSNHRSKLIKNPETKLSKIINHSLELPSLQRAATAHHSVDFIHNTVSNLTYSSYKLGGSRFDISRGIYIVDCSSYIDRILKVTHPAAFSRLATWSGNANPTTNDYYHYFQEIADGPQKHWLPIEDIGSLRPGDVIVFRYNQNTKGHIMILMDKPKRKANTVSIRVTDSAPIGHSQDTRKRRVSGIGIGTMMVKIHPKTSKPYAYAWQIGSPWRKNVAFAMARPVEINQEPHMIG